MKETSLYNSRLTIIFSVIFIIILGLFAYSSSINGEFIWDDNNLISYNEDIKTIDSITSIFTSSIAGSLGKIYKSYRPLQIISYMLDYKVWDYNPFGYHLMNCFLHIMVGLLIYWLCRLLFDDWVISFVAASIFVVLPVHTEAVAYISGRADSLVSAFLLLSFIFYIKYQKKQSISLFIFSLLACILALLSRENAILLPLLVLLYSYTFRKPLEKKLFFSIIAVVIFYVILRMTVFNFEVPSKDFYFYVTFWQRLPGVFIAIARYIKLLFIPAELHMGYGRKLFSYMNPLFYLGLLITILLIFYAVRSREKNKILSFGILWFYVCLLPQLNIYPINAYMAEHWLYLPSLGFCIIIAYYASHWWKIDRFRSTAFFITLLLITAYTITTYNQNMYWQDPITFCKRTLRYAPNNYQVYSLLSNAYVRELKYEKAIAAANESIKINPNYPYSYFNIGLAYMDMGECKKAISYFKKSVEINPDFVNAYNNMAVCYFHMGETDQAINVTKKIIQINPNYSRAYYNMILLYSAKGNTQKADEYEKLLNKMGYTFDEKVRESMIENSK
jgi:tetratricopeptide (TPR) repeat protein